LKSGHAGDIYGWTDLGELETGVTDKACGRSSQTKIVALLRDNRAASNNANAVKLAVCQTSSFISLPVSCFVPT
jgi:hypothetical protein